MAKIKGIDLTDAQRAELERGWRRGASHALRQRCRMVLLKAQGLRSKDVAAQVGCCEVVVNSWLRRYRAGGLEGLRTRAGRGRKPILAGEADREAARRAVRANRQRISLAKAELERETGRPHSVSTLKRFLKKTADATNACGGA